MFKFLARIIVGLVIAHSLLGCTSIGISRPSVEVSAAMDVGSTYLALERGGVELNPLGFWGTTLAKAYYLYCLRPTLNDSDRARWDRTLSSAWLGAATNNIIQLIWAPTLLVSLGVGVYVGLSAYSSGE